MPDTFQHPSYIKNLRLPMICKIFYGVLVQRLNNSPPAYRNFKYPYFDYCEVYYFC
jgi:hypothetical protein